MGGSRATVNGVEIAFEREGAGGYPLLLIHGWPETRRIWQRNVEPLAEAGFEVIAPDLRGFGDSGLAPDDRYDAAAHARDMEALLRELGHERCVVCAGDLGGVVAQDLSLRFEGLVDRLVLFNTIPPILPDSPPRDPARDADGRRLLHPPVARRRRPGRGARHARRSGARTSRRCTARASGPRRARSRREDIEFMTEPFGDAERFRASIANYEYAGGAAHARRSRRGCSSPTRSPTLVLYGPEDHVIPRDFPERMEVGVPRDRRPVRGAGAGHFLMWERATVLNRAIAALLPGPPGTISLQ